MSAADHNKKSLKQVAIFAGLSSESRRRFEGRCHWHTYRPGKEIIAFKGTATDVYFLTEGLARVIIHSPTGKDVVYRTIRPGDIFGEFSAIDGEPRSASVEVLQPSTVATMSSSVFRNAIMDEPEIAMALLRQLTTECRRLSRRVLEFSTFAVSNRIQAELLRLAGGYPSPSGDAVIQPAPTHTVIASRVSTHREAVTRELSKLTQLGVVERHGADLVIKDVARLAEMVQEAMGE
jgi:CRP/FNR family cyclic AMP-dependent transcriptional regulator